MNKQAMGTNVNPSTTPYTKPQWWTDKHTSTWDRVKEALRRDWEQTKSDFSATDAADLNQEVGDTLKQAAGAAPIPPPTVQTRPDDPKEAAKRVEKELKARGDAQGKVVEAQTEVAVERVRAQGKVASEQQAAQEKIADEQRKLGQISAEAREKAAKVEREAQEKLAKQQHKIGEVRAEASQKIAEVQHKAGEKIADVQQKVGEKAAVVRDWGGVEPAVQYGYGARSQYADAPGWDEAEDRLQREWGQMRGASTWDAARPHIRRGWDAATRTSVV